MASEPVISVASLSKRYVIEHESRHDNLRDTLHHTARKLWRRFRWGTGFQKEEFWALRDVSFEVQRGEVVGIIGRNGAGKSTLLKILSRITEPTQGRIELRGRVASLLEVGTGFHPELSGRENVFLNGAILGMSRAEIRRKFDEIVAFAEVEKFLDTPVKHYSSGMYVRLAFAVAAHLEPEILVVDEVLAVGDTEFQKKCLGKMQAVARDDGRTVLFVSHNLAIVRHLCPKALLLKQGRIACLGPTTEVLERYLATAGASESVWQRQRPPPPGCRGFITAVRLTDAARTAAVAFPCSDPVVVQVTAEVRQRIPSCQLAVRLSNHEGLPVFTTTNADSGGLLEALNPGRHEFEFAVPGAFLAAGRYAVTAMLLVPGIEVIDSVVDGLVLDLSSAPTHATKFNDYRQGVVTPLIPWKHTHAAQR
jgi:lipopolysaccharide transport system ATP-binding protein